MNLRKRSGRAFFPVAFLFKELNRLSRHYGGNGVLVNKLGMTVPAKQNAKIVKPSHHALQFYTIH